MRPFPDISSESRSPESELRDKHFIAQMERGRARGQRMPVRRFALLGALGLFAVGGSIPTWQSYGTGHPHCCVGPQETLWELIADLPRVLRQVPAEQVNWWYYQGYDVACVLLLLAGGAGGTALGWLTWRSRTPAIAAPIVAPIPSFEAIRATPNRN
jgi:hypothetical protein